MMILHFKNKRRLLTFTKEQQQYFDIVTEEFEKDKKGKYRAKDCPTSTLTNTFAINMLLLTAAKKESNLHFWLVCGDEKNKRLEEEYSSNVKHP